MSNGMDFTLEVKDNVELAKQQLNRAVEVALTAIGQQAVSHSARVCPVDTGRLRASIDSKVAKSEKAVYIGTNVEYAAPQEYGTAKIKGKHYLRHGATEYGSEYKAILKNAMKNA
jgi:Bacteriophage HK97-gp10, putative tail-component